MEQCKPPTVDTMVIFDHITEENGYIDISQFRTVQKI